MKARGLCLSCYQRRYARERRYGLKHEDAVRLLDAQGGRCPVCGLALMDSEAHVDHDHDTGEVRGLLHSRCNRSIGSFHDDPEELRRAADYLEG